MVPVDERLDFFHDGTAIRSIGSRCAMQGRVRIIEQGLPTRFALKHLDPPSFVMDFVNCHIGLPDQLCPLPDIDP